MSLLERLLKFFGYSRTPRLTFDMDQTLIQSLQTLAEQEKREPDEVAADLLTFALAQRRAADDNLDRWHTLTPREQQIAALACLNYTNRQIAAQRPKP